MRPDERLRNVVLKVVVDETYAGKAHQQRIGGHDHSRAGHILYCVLGFGGSHLQGDGLGLLLRRPVFYLRRLIISLFDHFFLFLVLCPPVTFPHFVFGFLVPRCVLPSPPP